jgi:hypothetical protein
MGLGLGRLNPFRESSPLNPSNLLDTAGDIGQGTIDLSKELLKPAVKVGKWAWENPVEAAALAAAGYYFAPEIGAWIDSAGSAVAGTEAGTAAGATTLTASEVAAQQTAAAQIAAQNAAWDAAAIDLASSASPVFATSAAAQGLTLKQGLDAARAGLLVNALTGDPLGLNDVTGSGGNTFANQGFAQVPIPEDWTSPTYTYSPVQNVTFEDLFPAVSLQGTQWQNMPQAQTFNEMFASGQQQTPMGSPVDINQIVGSILGQSATS